ncbi:MAG TPA: FKBP-type peptidyl-prolyl cis-trans isomerase [Gemmatimonadaceae bacterium]|nr:FKBP-type peptidyl-prolyl cis-trans isomerase [Gemmatimonadaceae bacterium]
MTTAFRAISVIAVLGMSGLVAACSTDVEEPVSVSIEKTTFASSLGVNLAASTRTANGVYYRDITVGSGPVVANGQQITVRYTGWLSNGTQFDSNTTTGFPFVLGIGRVIAGWDEGLQGIRVGGKRQLIIPPSMGYGSSGNGPIPGNAVIVFNVEVVSSP